MTRKIRQAAVIGSGVMGGGIAALLASAGVKTLLLDIVPFDLKPEDRFRFRFPDDDVFAASIAARREPDPKRAHGAPQADSPNRKVRLGGSEVQRFGSENP